LTRGFCNPAKKKETRLIRSRPVLPREICYDHTFENEDELRIGVGFLGLSVGPQKDIKFQLPNYMTKERYDRAYLDLTAQCPGSSGGY
jgi:hypothetical protein|tara:strand:+ start:558 stop:821 length:264 start_codon:yes stop_codon:yes gene_type:complete